MKLILPLPTSINATYRMGNGKYYKSSQAREWELEASTAYWQQKMPITASTDNVALGIVLYLKRDRDIDSGLKILLDFLQGKIYKNDRQVVTLHVTKLYSDKPRVEVWIDTNKNKLNNL